MSLTSDRLSATRVGLALVGLLVAEAPFLLFLLAVPEIAAGSGDVGLIAVLGGLSALPYILYAWRVRTRSVTLAGGLVLILIPAVPYADTFFFSGSEGSFAPATVPPAAVLASVVLLAVDAAILARKNGSR